MDGDVMNEDDIRARINRIVGITAARTRAARTSQIRRGMRNRARRVSAGGQGG